MKTTQREAVDSAAKAVKSAVAAHSAGRKSGSGSALTSNAGKTAVAGKAIGKKSDAVTRSRRERRNPCAPSERRSFVAGAALEDWSAAEQEVKRLLNVDDFGGLGGFGGSGGLGGFGDTFW